MADRRRQIEPTHGHFGPSASRYAKGCRCEDCREAYRVYRKKVEARDPERYRGYGRADYSRHVEKRRETSRTWREANAEYRRVYCREKIAYRRRIINRYKELKGCAHCGSRIVYLLQFHHRDPATKSFDISQALSRGWDAIKAEVAKCDVVCQPCHVEHHRNRRAA